jgi:hypothetical protein
LVALAVLALLLIVGLWSFLQIKTAAKRYTTLPIQGDPHYPTSPVTLFILLGALFFLFLVPAIITIRLEQRWLQAPYSIFILLVLIAATGVYKQKNKWVLPVFAGIASLFLYNDYYYLSSGMGNLYLTGAHNAALLFEKGVKNEEIRTNAKRLYVIEKTRNTNDENGLIWAIGNGYIIDFYQNNHKQILFTDSVYQRTVSATDTTFKQFNPTSDEIVLLKDHIIDLTNDYRKDTLRNLKMD